MHIKQDTNGIKISDLQDIFKTVLVDQAELNLPNQNALVIDLIYQEADSALTYSFDSVDLEIKIILSIAIRLKAEEFMINKIDNPEFINSLKSNQTIQLFKKYTSLEDADQDIIELLGQVNLMTPRIFTSTLLCLNPF